LERLFDIVEKSQRGYRELIDSFDDVVFAVGLDGKLQAANRSLEDLLGEPIDALVGRDLGELLAEPSREAATTGLPRFLERRSWNGIVKVRVRKTGGVRYYDTILQAIIHDGQVTGVSALARDVTKAREAEARSTELFETLQEGMYICNPDGKLIEVNPALLAILGYDSKEELLSQPPEAFKVDASADPVLGRAESHGHQTRTREVRLRKKDGSVAICQDTSIGVVEDGRTVRYQGTLVDVTEKRAMERQLRSQEEFRRHLLESFPDLILVLDLKGKYTFVSPRIREILGYGPEALLGKSVQETGNSSPELAKLYQTVAAGENSRASCEYGARHQDGNWRTMLGMASPLLDAEDKLSGVILSVRDVTTEKKLEQQIIQSERLAAMGQMIGGFAHELNNPLTAILGNAQLLEERETDETSRKRLETLNQEARKAADIVKNLQFFARPPAPGRSLVDLNELVQRTVHLQSYPLRKSNITVDFLPEPSLPAVVADSNQLMQVFLNLLLNAEQAIRESRDRGTIRVRLGRGAPGNSNSVWIVFQDDGPGIAPENLPHIFDPFFTTRRPGRGTGLGLSICKTVLREHGGNIEAATAPGGGAVFTITLPLGAAEAAAK